MRHGCGELRLASGHSPVQELAPATLLSRRLAAQCTVGSLRCVRAAGACAEPSSPCQASAEGCQAAKERKHRRYETEASCGTRGVALRAGPPGAC